MMEEKREEAYWFLESCYVKVFVDDIINNDRIFGFLKLRTPTRMVRTMAKDGYDPELEGVFNHE